MGVPSVVDVQNAVAVFYGLKSRDFRSNGRTYRIARPRMLAMTIARQYTGKSLLQIGALFGGRDHTTVLNAIRRTRVRIEEGELPIEIVVCIGLYMARPEMQWRGHCHAEMEAAHAVGNFCRSLPRGKIYFHVPKLPFASVTRARAA